MLKGFNLFKWLHRINKIEDISPVYYLQFLPESDP